MKSMISDGNFRDKNRDENGHQNQGENRADFADCTALRRSGNDADQPTQGRKIGFALNTGEPPEL